MTGEEHQKNTYLFGVRRATHHVTVRSNMKGFPDTKTFGIHAPQQKLERLKSICEEAIMEAREKGGALHENIYLVGEEKKTTHVILIQEPEKKKPRRAKSFRVRNPSYSAEEIADTLRKKLTGGAS